MSVEDTSQIPNTPDQNSTPYGGAIRVGSIIVSKIHDSNESKSFASQLTTAFQWMARLKHSSATHVAIVVGFTDDGQPICAESNFFTNKDGESVTGVMIRRLDDVQHGTSLSVYNINNPIIETKLAQNALGYFEADAPDKFKTLQQGDYILNNANIRYKKREVFYATLPTSKSPVQSAENYDTYARLLTSTSEDDKGVMCSQFANIVLGKTIHDLGLNIETCSSNISPASFSTYLKSNGCEKINIESPFESISHSETKSICSAKWIVQEMEKFLLDKLSKTQRSNNDEQSQKMMIKLLKESLKLNEDENKALTRSLDLLHDWSQKSLLALLQNPQWTKVEKKTHSETLRKIRQVYELSNNMDYIKRFDNDVIELLKSQIKITLKQDISESAQTPESSIPQLKILQAYDNAWKEILKDSTLSANRFTEGMNLFFENIKDLNLSDKLRFELTQSFKKAYQLFNYMKPSDSAIAMAFKNQQEIEKENTTSASADSEELEEYEEYEEREKMISYKPGADEESDDELKEIFAKKPMLSFSNGPKIVQQPKSPVPETPEPKSKKPSADSGMR